MGRVLDTEWKASTWWQRLSNSTSGVEIKTDFTRRLLFHDMNYGVVFCLHFHWFHLQYFQSCKKKDTVLKKRKLYYNLFYTLTLS